MRTFWTLLAATALCIGAQAQTLLYSTGFENPPFVAGQSAVGVAGWAAGSGGGASQTVSSAVACSGSQSLRWDNSGTLNSFYSIYRSLNWNPTSAANSRLIVRASVRISADAGPDRLYGVYLSTGASLSGTVLGVTIAGDGKIRVGTSWGATYSSTTWLAQAPAGTYADRCLQVEIVYDAGSGQATITVSGFADGATYSANLSQTTVPVNIHLGTDYVTTANRAGIGYFDDVQIFEASGSPILPSQITLTDGDTTFTLRGIRGERTTAAGGSGDYRSVSGGPDHLFQNWWWFRTDADSREFALSNLTAFDQPAPNTATLTYTEGTLSITLQYTLTDTGDNQAKLRINATVTNNGSSDVTVNLFNYSDFDMDGTIGADTGSLVASGHMSVSEGANTAHIFTINPPFAWQMGAFPSVRNLLTDTDVDDLNNSGSPFGPGDWTGAFQWRLSLNAGGSRLIRMLVNLNVAPALCEGDANGDGVVNNADLLLVLFAFGQTGARVEDVNGDGVVNNADLLVVLFNFGCSN